METKYCKSCRIDHPLNKEFWYPKRDKEFGLCKISSLQRKKKYYKEGRYTKRNRTLDNKYKASIKGRFANLKKETKRRNLNLDLTIEQYQQIVLNSCFYDSSHLLPIYGTGLDRIDNNLGYTLDNVVPCCYNCNRIRNDSMSHEEMIEVANLLKRLRSEKN